LTWWWIGTGFFARQFLPENPAAPPVNILLFGMAGSSKSSLINGMYTMLGRYPVVVKEAAKAGGNTVRVSTELKRYRLAPFDQNMKPEPALMSHIRLWDTWGLETKENYAGVIFEDILNGAHDKDISIQAGETVARRSSVGTPNPEFRKHCVIFCIPASEVVEAETPMKAKTVTFMNRCSDQNVRVILAITMVDRHLKTIKRNEPLRKQTGVPELIQKGALAFNLPANRVFPVINYTEERQRLWSIDVNYFELLAAAAEVGSMENVQKEFDILDS
jgi:predicted GTPase